MNLHGNGKHQTNIDKTADKITYERRTPGLHISRQTPECQNYNFNGIISKPMSVINFNKYNTTINIRFTYSLLDYN